MEQPNSGAGTGEPAEPTLTVRDVLNALDSVSYCHGCWSEKAELVSEQLKRLPPDLVIEVRP